MKLRPKAKQQEYSRLALRAPMQLLNDLQLYSAFYEKETGQVIATPELAVEVLNQFMASDREFKRFKRNSREDSIS